jgi:hypothetical protein
MLLRAADAANMRRACVHAECRTLAASDSCVGREQLTIGWGRAAR